MDSWTKSTGHGGYWCENGACVTKMCVDDDNTYAPFKSGNENTFSQNSLSKKNKVVGMGPGGNVIEDGWSDFCSAEGIQEYYCNTENVVGVSWWECPTGTACQDGACVTTNVDSDNDGVVSTNDICPTVGETGKVYPTGNMGGCWYGDLDHDGCVGDENIAAAIDLFYDCTLTDDQIAVAVDMALSGKGCKNQ
jgi:hypothetical protein